MYYISVLFFFGCRQRSVRSGCCVSVRSKWIHLSRLHLFLVRGLTFQTKHTATHTHSLYKQQLFTQRACEFGTEDISSKLNTFFLQVSDWKH